MGFGNIAAVVKLELYSGAVDAGGDTGYAEKVPVSESDIGIVNNKVADGLTFPSLNVF